MREGQKERKTPSKEPFFLHQPPLVELLDSVVPCWQPASSRSDYQNKRQELRKSQFGDKGERPCWPKENARHETLKSKVYSSKNDLIRNLFVVQQQFTVSASKQSWRDDVCLFLLQSDTQIIQSASIFVCRHLLIITIFLACAHTLMQTTVSSSFFFSYMRRLLKKACKHKCHNSSTVWHLPLNYLIS